MSINGGCRDAGAEHGGPTVDGDCDDLRRQIMLWLRVGAGVVIDDGDDWHCHRCRRVVVVVTGALPPDDGSISIIVIVVQLGWW